MSNTAILKIMIKRDLVIQMRHWKEFLFRVAMLPFILILIYGYVLPKIGILSTTFPNQMFPGMVGMSLLITGIHGTAVPMALDFHQSREIEDRLQAPVNVTYIALAKMIVGVIEAWVGAFLVLPISLIFMGSHLKFQMDVKQWLLFILIFLMASVTSATFGLLVGTIIKPMQIAAMFPGLLMPIIFTGAIFFSWDRLSVVPVFKYLILINPLVYINEALRSAFFGQSSAMPLWASIAGIIVFSLGMGWIGIRRFKKMTKK